MRNFFLLVLFLPFCISAKAYGPRASLESQLERFHLADAEFEARHLADPLTRDFYLCQIRAYQYLSTQNPGYLQGFFANWEPAVKKLESEDDGNPMKGVMLAELYGKRATIEFLQTNYFASMRMVRNCRRWIKKTEEAFPDNVEQLKYQGLFNIVFAAVPKKYQWITHALGYVGDAELGLEQLDKAAAEGSLLSYEAEIIAFFSEKNILNRPEAALKRLIQVRKKKGGSVLLDFLLASAHGGLHQNEKALMILKDRERYAANDRVFFFPFWDHALAKSLYFKGAYPQAEKAFQRFLSHHKGNIYQVDALFRLGMSQCLNEKPALAKKTFAKLDGLSVSAFDEDEYAMAMARRFADTLPSANLLALFRARNFFDGGYLEEATAILDGLRGQTSRLSPAEITELHYRYGRIHHIKKAWDAASKSYRFCLAQPATDQKWMQAYAAYYLGEIAQQQGDKQAAKQAYEHALRYDGYYYQGGLESRCKAALSSLKKS